MRLSKVLELPLQQNRGWLEGVCCCCWAFSELERRSSLQLFWYFPRNWLPYLYSSLLLSGREPSEQAVIAVFLKQSSFVEES